LAFSSVLSKGKCWVLKEKTGQLIFESNLRKKYYKHPNKDLILLHLHDEETAITQAKINGIPWSSLYLNTNIGEGDTVTLVGHDLKSIEDDINPVTERLIPTWTHGKISLMNNKQGYISTPAAIQMGMCGGPVIKNKTGDCVGIIEAVVSQLKQNAGAIPGAIEFYSLVANNTVFIPAEELIQFILDVEEQIKLDYK